MRGKWCALISSCHGKVIGVNLLECNPCLLKIRAVLPLSNWQCHSHRLNGSQVDLLLCTSIPPKQQVMRRSSASESSAQFSCLCKPVMQEIVLPEEAPEWVPLDPAEGRTVAGQARSPGSMRQQLNSLAQLLESPPPVCPSP